MTGSDFAKAYFDRRGIQVELRSTRCVRSQRLSLSGLDEERVSAKILYIGPAGGCPASYIFENDPMVRRFVSSPSVAEEASAPPACYVLRDGRGSLWTGYWSKVFIRDEDLYEDGLLIELEIPEIVAEKAPVFTVSVNGEVLLEETVTEGGLFSRRIDLHGVSRRILSYMEEVRECQKAVFDEFVRVCEKYDLSWHLVCGGLIGLMRDGSLLPWDDDLDVAMPRADYEKLVSAAKTEWKEGGDYLLLTPDGYGKNVFFDYMTRLVYMKERVSGDLFDRLGDRGRQDIHCRVPIDIYILQDAYDSKVKHYLQTRFLQLCYVLALGHRRLKRVPGYRFRDRIRLTIVRMVRAAGSLIPLQTELRWYFMAAGASSGKPGRCCFQSNGYHACIPMRFEKSWFGEGREIEKDGFVFRIPADADSFLRTMYGDYTKFPPFKDRDPMHCRTGGKEEKAE